jgi:hypothetical protein
MHAHLFNLQAGKKKAYCGMTNISTPDPPRLKKQCGVHLVRSICFYNHRAKHSGSIAENKTNIKIGSLWNNNLWEWQEKSHLCSIRAKKKHWILIGVAEN